ncbi:general stress protein CsbD [Lewinellaceae bacterium SD302]|nr:general stress protein CsbD [Lewinellaceae bacterium SD302]
MSANEDRIRGDWNQVKGKAKEEYGQLTDDDLMVAEGKEDQFWGNLQEKLGKTKQEVKEWIDSL